MKERVSFEFGSRKPQHAEGHICIDLTDPLTGKVKERFEAENHVYQEMMFDAMASGPSSGGWIADLQWTPLWLTDSLLDVDTTFPMVFGQVVGYGTPSQGSTGTRRGAYNSANQVLGSKNGTTSMRWKYQYDFTTAQANGTIGTLGLTNQVNGCSPYGQMIKFATAKCPQIGGNLSDNYGLCTNDGKYAYSCSTVGVISQRDLMLGTTVTKDISAIIGATSNSYKTVVYFSDSGKYGIYVYNATTSLIRLYIFSDNTFTTLEATHSPSNILLSGATGGYPMYGYGDYIFLVNDSSIQYANYVSNTAFSTVTPTYSYFAQNDALSNYSTKMLNLGTMASGKYLLFGFTCYSYYRYPVAGVLDMSSFTQIGYASGQYTLLNNHYHPIIKNPFYPDKCIPVYAPPTDYLRPIGAVTAKKLDTPVVKTAANGMTVTYELEVFW